MKENELSSVIPDAAGPKKIKREKTLGRIGNKYVSVRDISLIAAGLFIGIIFGPLLLSLTPGAIQPLSETILSDGETALQTINNKIFELSPQYVSSQSGFNLKNGADLEKKGATEFISANMSYDVNDYIGTLPYDDEETYVAGIIASTMDGQAPEDEEYIRKRWALYQTILGYNLGELQGLSVEAFLRTPRQYFVREKNLPRAYDDSWLPVGYGATITDPDVVAMMTTTLDVRPGLKVLEIGTGSGYQSAILSNITNDVYSIEIIEPLFYETNELYNELAASYPSYNNIRRKLGDGYYGWVKYAPFDRIIVTCSIDHLPPPLLQQLAPDGIMVVPLGHPGKQYIMEVKKTVDESGREVLERRDVYNGLSVRFIPFRDEAGTSYSK